MQVVIDEKSGFCFGVEKAIQKAEEVLAEDKSLYCLGQIVHNEREIERLEKLGLIIITHDQYKKLSNCKVLIRAHGEPPETYDYAKKNNITLVEATCPVVLKLQEKIKKANIQPKNNQTQVVIYGKKDHAEVIGLAGQTNYCAILIQDEADLGKVDYKKPIHLFSQTTKSTEGYQKIIDEIKQGVENSGGNMNDITAINSICRQVSNRAEQLQDFCMDHDVILFVSGRNSSNGKALYEICKEKNNKSYFITGEEEVNPDWFFEVSSIGICGATSTPKWLMQNVADKIKSLNL